MDRYTYAPLLLFQFVLLGLYCIFTTYVDNTAIVTVTGFQDTHVMIFIGFGFLMTFLKKYCYSAVGLNLFLAALVIQWALLCESFFHMKNYTIQVNMKSLIRADIMSATVLITFGALLGLTSVRQMLFIAIIETAVGCGNLYVIEHVLKASDVGGSIAIHAFGAYFGLGVSAALGIKDINSEDIPFAPKVKLNAPSYVSDVTAMVGSLFLWVYWPSFNAGLTTYSYDYHRAVVHTYLSLAASTVTAFVVSSMVNHKKGTFDMVHVQNSTLAGGVAVGAICNMFISPGIAIAVGMLAGAGSVLGYRFLTPAMESVGIQDTCGVNNLHGMPGVLSGLLSGLFASFANIELYGEELHIIFEGMEEGGRTAAQQGKYQLAALASTLIISSIAGLITGGRTAAQQGKYQLAALASTLIISSIAGLITGFIAKIPPCIPLEKAERFDDDINWELP